MTDQLRAVIYVLAGPDVTRQAAECSAHCDRRGYHVAAVVIGTTSGKEWGDVLRMLYDDDAADVVVMPSRSVLSEHRTPRLETLTQEFLAADLPPDRRRPRRLWPRNRRP